MQVLLINSLTRSIHKHTINSACLPHKDDRPLYGTECFIAGYGYTVYDRSQSIPSKLQETSVPLIDYETCAEWFHLENSRTGNLVYDLVALASDSYWLSYWA